MVVLVGLKAAKKPAFVVEPFCMVVFPNPVVVVVVVAANIDDDDGVIPNAKSEFLAAASETTLPAVVVAATNVVAAVVGREWLAPNLKPPKLFEAVVGI